MGLTTFNRARRLEAERLAANGGEAESPAASEPPKDAKSDPPKRSRRKVSGEKSSG